MCNITETLFFHLSSEWNSFFLFMLAKFGLRAYSIQWILLALDTHTDYIVDIANNDDNNYETLSKDEEIFIRRSDFWDEKNFYVKKEFSETRKSVFEGFDMITCRNVSIFRALDYILDTTRNNFSDSLFWRFGKMSFSSWNRRKIRIDLKRSTLFTADKG